MKNIRVLCKDPGKLPQMVTISNKLQSFQKAVGGYIETFRFAKDAVIICNEEGKIKNLPFNVRLLGEDFVGTILIAGVQGEEFTSFDFPVEKLNRLLPELWRC